MLGGRLDGGPGEMLGGRLDGGPGEMLGGRLDGGPGEMLGGRLDGGPGKVLGGGLDEVGPWSLRMLLWLMTAAPIFALMLLWEGIFWLPVHAGSFLPTVPVFLFVSGMILPLALPVGAFIPGLLRFESVTIGEVYGLEALGGFAGGVLFSLALAGSAPSFSTLAVLPLITLSAIVLLGGRRKTAGLLALLWGPVVAFGFPAIDRMLEERLWEHFHPGYSLESVFETPYQKIQVGDYSGQKSLFCNGSFAAAWPDPSKAEERAHSFLTVIPDPRRVLILGTPTPDLLDEFKKYVNLEITVAELDTKLLKYFSKLAKANSGLSFRDEDPRAFLKKHPGRFDGILLLPADPTTLVGNRLFTCEAFAEMGGALATQGVLMVSVAGTENYLGSEMEKVILSAHRALKASFKDVFALPGDPIGFWAAKMPGIIATDPQVLGKRFEARRIQTVCFQPLSFRNLLLPFRVDEVRGWLKRSSETSFNTDLHPFSFSCQLMLWDIYSNSRMSFLIGFFERLDLRAAFLMMAFVALAFFFWLRVAESGRGNVALLVSGIAISGAAGLLAEIVLMMLYQNRNGAMFKMVALFFGLYMLGLSAGAHLGKAWGFSTFGRLLLLKASQLGISGSCFFLLWLPEWHSGPVIGVAIFLAAFLDGIEFPSVDAILKRQGVSASSSGGLLIFSDNFGALWVGFLSGVWLLPTLGLPGSLLLITGALFLNFVFLAVFRPVGGNPQLENG